METEYTMASLYFLTEGKDGFHMFLDDKVVKVTDRDDSPTIQDILKNFFITFQKSDEEIENMPKRAQKIFEDRLEILGASKDDRDQNGLIKIKPSLQGRIVNVDL